MSLPNTHYGPEAISVILKGKKNLFFDGIGGVSMSALAHVSHLRGYKVSGYDRTPSEITKKLEDLGIEVYYEADASHIRHTDALIYTVAMPEDNPEYLCAKKYGIPRISRADYLGWLMTGYERRIGVSGTHGKSTTTGMLARMLSHAGVDPTVLCGAPLKETGTVDLIGGTQYFAFEACEYMDSFLDFRPTTTIILNIELDHVDYFRSLLQMRESFTKFANIAGEDGYVVLNLDDPNCQKIVDDCVSHHVTFGRNNKKADYSSANENLNGGCPEFDVLYKGEFLTHVALKIPGEHNISNALGALAACCANGIPAETAAEGLSEFEGIGRRMEKLGTMENGAFVYSDYAHHPTEIAATLKAARSVCPGKLRVIFQPHTYSRTSALFTDFVRAFASSPADEVVLLDIYAARETNEFGVTSDKLADAIAAAGKPSFKAADFASAADYMKENAGEGDIVLVMGAGDVIHVADSLLETKK